MDKKPKLRLVESGEERHQPSEEVGRIALELLQQVLRPTLEQALGPLAPGSLLGDVCRAGDQSLPEDECVAAVQRLARKWFTRGVCFYPDRWNLLLPHFYIRMREEDDPNWATVWDQLAHPAIYLACNDPELEGVSLTTLYVELRKRIRGEIERSLLHGKTLDTTEDEAWPANAETLALEAEYQDELAELLPQGLPDEALALLLAERGELKTLAEKRGKSYPAVRQERVRLLKWIREVVSQFA